MNEQILVIGSEGFLGKHVKRILDIQENDYIEIYCPAYNNILTELGNIVPQSIRDKLFNYSPNLIIGEKNKIE